MKRLHIDEKKRHVVADAVLVHLVEGLNGDIEHIQKDFTNLLILTGKKCRVKQFDQNQEGLDW